MLDKIFLLLTQDFIAFSNSKILFTIGQAFHSMPLDAYPAIEFQTDDRIFETQLHGLD